VIDVHAHIHGPDFEADLEQVLRRASRAGVKAVISASVDVSDSLRCLKVAGGHSMVYPEIGLAPYSDLGQLEDMLRLIQERRSEIVGIGEIGLDYPWEKHPEQVEPFRRQVRLAKKLGLPVTVHSRSAGKYVLDILEEEGAERVHLHSFGGSKKDVRRAVSLGYYFSINCRVAVSRKIQDMVLMLPEDLILLETDSPVLGLAPGRNEPANLAKNAEAVSKLLKVKPEEFEKIAEENSKRIFSRIDL